MKVVFVDNLILPEPGDIENIDTHPHLGLLSLAAVVRKAGHEVCIFDPKLAIKNKHVNYDETLYSKSAKLIAKLSPDVVGFTSMGCSFIYTAKVAEQLKILLPGTSLLMGGPHASILWHSILSEFTQFMAVVCHEAEETIIPVLNNVENRNFNGIPGVCWRDENGKIHSNGGKPTIDNLDELPIPDYSHYPIDLSKLKSIRIDAGRGCPFDCTFCSTASYFGRSYRLKSAARLLEEMDFLHDNYGFTDFKLNHDLFTVNKKKVHQFCDAVRNRKYTWAVSARIDCVNRALLEDMWDAGCRAIYFGVETGSVRMQKISAKRLKLELLESTLDICEQMGFQITCSYITGYPEENLQDQQDTLNTLGKCFYRDREKFITQLHMLTPEPGTALYQQAYPFTEMNTIPVWTNEGDNHFQYSIKYDGYQTDFNGDWLDDTEEKLIRKHPNIFVPHYYFSSILSRTQHIHVVESYKILRKLGHTIISYLLRYYKHSFSNLVEHLCNHLDTAKIAQPTIQNVIDYFVKEFDSTHHVSSLVRYALLTENARKNPPRNMNSETSYNESQNYILRPGTYLFRNIHDCSMLIEKIRSNVKMPSPFKEHEVGDRGCFLVASHHDCDSALTNYRIDLVTYTLIQSFIEPTNLKNLKNRLTSKLKVNDIDIDNSSISHLLEKGLIYPQEQIQVS